MHTAQLLSLAVHVVRGLGYDVREEPLEGAGGGHCIIRGRKWLLLDLAQSQQDQLNDALDALRNEPQLDRRDLPPELAERLQLEKAA